MKLYFAPNSRAVRIAWLLEELGLEYESKNIQLGIEHYELQNIIKFIQWEEFLF